MSDTLDLLLGRRSVKAIEMIEPGPTDAELELILRAAARVPDHGKLGPWRFVRFTGDARLAFGQVLVDAWRAAHPDDEDARVELERGRLVRGPVVVAVISAVLPGHKIPEWEQVLSAGAVCMNMLTAAHASGYVAQWLTEWYSYDEQVRAALALGSDERVAGFIYLGSPLQAPKERVRPDLEERISDWSPPA
jgi:nitroreductase